MSFVLHTQARNPTPGHAWYGIRGAASGELLSLKGAVIIHNNPREIEFILAGTGGPVGLPGKDPKDVATKLMRRTMLLRDHPDLSNIKWPLDRNDFWDPQGRNYTLKEMVEVRRLQWQ